MQIHGFQPLTLQIFCDHKLLLGCVWYQDKNEKENSINLIQEIYFPYFYSHTKHTLIVNNLGYNMFFFFKEKRT